MALAEPCTGDGFVPAGKGWSRTLQHVLQRGHVRRAAGPQGDDVNGDFVSPVVVVAVGVQYRRICSMVLSAICLGRPLEGQCLPMKAVDHAVEGLRERRAEYHPA